MVRNYQRWNHERERAARERAYDNTPSPCKENVIGHAANAIPQQVILSRCKEPALNLIQESRRQ